MKKSNVKLQAQRIVAYDGDSLKWHSWNNKMRAAVGTAGMLKVLENKEYATKNVIDNETIFHLLQVATADGNAAHLVDMHENDKSGHLAYQELVKWFEGDELTTETAEDVRAKMDKLSLTTKNTASQYINQFLQHKKHLEELKEEYTPSKTVNIFLTQITDPDYEMTVEHCLENRVDIKTCIERIRAKERRIDRIRGAKRNNTVVIRRQNTPNQNEDMDKPIKLEDYKTEKGFFSVPSNVWFGLSDDDKAYVRSYNKKRRREREDSDANEDTPTAKRRNTIRTRRNSTDDSQASDKIAGSRKTKAVEFRDVEDDAERDDIEEKDPNKTENKRVVQRRGTLRFRVKDDN